MVKFVDESANPFPDKPPIAKKQSDVDAAREIHLTSDVDYSVSAQHHTLGTGPTQAAQGSHLHSQYAQSSHSHLSADLPTIIIPDEIIVSDTAPVGIDEGTIWIDSSIPDATQEGIWGTWGTDIASTNSTTLAHPSNWATPLYVPPRDGFIDISAMVRIDSNALASGTRSRFQLEVTDNADTVINNSLALSDRLAYFTMNNHLTVPVVGGTTYKIKYKFSIISGSGTLDIDLPTMKLVYHPSTQYTTVVYTTSP